MNFPTLTKISKFKYGNYEMKPSYKTNLKSGDGVLSVCYRCLSQFITEKSLELHLEECKTVPFKSIYEENDSLKISRITSLNLRQLLSQLGEMFIKTKTVSVDIERYEFYVLISDERIVGYFSRHMEFDASLSCILVFPCFQRQGFGTFLIDFSQAPIFKSKVIKTTDQILEESRKKIHINDDELNDKLECPNGPERPLSKAAIFLYRKYWKYKVIGAKTVKDIALRRNISIEDAIIGLELIGFDFKEWKMKNEKIDVEKPRLLKNQVVLCKKKL
ncbi:KAT8 [Hepatospora eriocheir]|uniref:KAT8 n=1 Tax=Hepatospora eriocheir TaxID=1081669 RepID=A0A1X0QDL4_9MICR|nr:KAT8 [Hepatospora eriocheir]